MRFPQPPQFSKVRLALMLPGIRRPAFFPAWSWMGQIKGARRVVIGLIGTQDQLRLGVVRQAGLEGDKPWPSTPEVWALDGISGTRGSFRRSPTRRYASRRG